MTLGPLPQPNKVYCLSLSRRYIKLDDDKSGELSQRWLDEKVIELSRCLEAVCIGMMVNHLLHEVDLWTSR